jgi:hypothetical protein
MCISHSTSTGFKAIKRLLSLLIHNNLLPPAYTTHSTKKTLPAQIADAYAREVSSIF